MERIKNWHILDRKMPITMAPYASDILVVIGAFSVTFFHHSLHEHVDKKIV